MAVESGMTVMKQRRRVSLIGDFHPPSSGGQK